MTPQQKLTKLSTMPIPKYAVLLIVRTGLTRNGRPVLQPILFHVCECVSHLSFRPAHGFPNNWKIDGDYPPPGGQCNSFFWWNSPL
jgi:hypothetical protein